MPQNSRLLTLLSVDPLTILNANNQNVKYQQSKSLPSEKSGDIDENSCVNLCNPKKPFTQPNPVKTKNELLMSSQRDQTAHLIDNNKDASALLDETKPEQKVNTCNSSDISIETAIKSCVDELVDIIIPPSPDHHSGNQKATVFPPAPNTPRTALAEAYIRSCVLAQDTSYTNNIRYTTENSVVPSNDWPQDSTVSIYSAHLPNFIIIQEIKSAIAFFLNATMSAEEGDEHSVIRPSGIEELMVSIKSMSVSTPVESTPRESCSIVSSYVGGDSDNKREELHQVTHEQLLPPASVSCKTKKTVADSLDDFQRAIKDIIDTSAFPFSHSTWDTTQDRCNTGLSYALSLLYRQVSIFVSIWRGNYTLSDSDYVSSSEDVKLPRENLLHDSVTEKGLQEPSSHTSLSILSDMDSTCEAIHSAHNATTTDDHDTCAGQLHIIQKWLTNFLESFEFSDFGGQNNKIALLLPKNTCCNKSTQNKTESQSVLSEEDKVTEGPHQQNKGNAISLSSNPPHQHNESDRVIHQYSKIAQTNNIICSSPAKTQQQYIPNVPSKGIKSNNNVFSHKKFFEAFVARNDEIEAYRVARSAICLFSKVVSAHPDDLQFPREPNIDPNQVRTIVSNLNETTDAIAKVRVQLDKDLLSAAAKWSRACVDTITANQLITPQTIKSEKERHHSQQVSIMTMQQDIYRYLLSPGEVLALSLSGVLTNERSYKEPSAGSEEVRPPRLFHDILTDDVNKVICSCLRLSSGVWSSFLKRKDLQEDSNKISKRVYRLASTSLVVPTTPFLQGVYSYHPLRASMRVAVESYTFGKDGVYYPMIIGQWLLREAAIIGIDRCMSRAAIKMDGNNNNCISDQSIALAKMGHMLFGPSLFLESKALTWQICGAACGGVRALKALTAPINVTKDYGLAITQKIANSFRSRGSQSVSPSGAVSRRTNPIPPKDASLSPSASPDTPRKELSKFLTLSLVNDLSIAGVSTSSLHSIMPSEAVAMALTEFKGITSSSSQSFLWAADNNNNSNDTSMQKLSYFNQFLGMYYLDLHYGNNKINKPPCPIEIVTETKDAPATRNRVAEAKDMFYNIPAMSFERHPDLKPKMRLVLVDWMLEVCSQNKFDDETFILAVALVDRFLSTVSTDGNSPILRYHLQLISVVSINIAAKYEEVYPPSIKDYLYQVSDDYTLEEFHQCESLILQTLRYDIHTPTVFAFAMGILNQTSSYSEGSICTTLPSSSYNNNNNIRDISRTQAPPSAAGSHLEYSLVIYMCHIVTVYSPYGGPQPPSVMAAAIIHIARIWAAEVMCSCSLTHAKAADTKLSKDTNNNNNNKQGLKTALEDDNIMRSVFINIETLYNYKVPHCRSLLCALSYICRYLELEISNSYHQRRVCMEVFVQCYYAERVLMMESSIYVIGRMIASQYIAVDRYKRNVIGGNGPIGLHNNNSNSNSNSNSSDALPPSISLDEELHNMANASDILTTYYLSNPRLYTILQGFVSDRAQEIEHATAHISHSSKEAADVIFAFDQKHKRNVMSYVTSAVHKDREKGTGESAGEGNNNNKRISVFEKFLSRKYDCVSLLPIPVNFLKLLPVCEM